MVVLASKFFIVAFAGLVAAAPLRLTRRAFQEQEYVIPPCRLPFILRSTFN